MDRRIFINHFSLISLAFAGGKAFAQNEQQRQPGNFSFNDSFVRISKKNPLYFELSNGEPYIVNGPCLSGAADMVTMQSYLKELSANEGNFARVWLCHPLFEIEQQYGVYNEEKVRNIDQLLQWAKQYNIKLKLCLENTRQIVPEKAPFNKPQYHVDNGGPFHNIDEYINTENGKKVYLNRMDFFSRRYKDHPAIFGWELWNEMNGIMCKGLQPWNDFMLPEVHKRFPNHLVLQSLGSFDKEERRPDYRYINKLPSNDVAQIHRYIDAGAKLDICTAPMDKLSSNAIDELRSYHIQKPMLLAEVGAVLPNHTGASELYPLDTDGILLHDMLFAPFFSGAAGSGNSWHWDKYIDKNNLWYHFKKFNETIKGIDPIAEKFIPVQMNHERFSIYILAGNKTLLAWCRDVKNDWKSEFVEGKKPEEIWQQQIDFTNILSPSSIKKVSFYDPWSNRWSAGNRSSIVKLPPCKRSLIIKIEK